MKRICNLFCLVFLVACQHSNDGKTMVVSGNVEGLKKGTLYLQRFDTQGNIVNVDSAKAKGNGLFEFKVPLESPEIFMLYLDKNNKSSEYGNRISFFAEPKHINIHTHNESFDLTAHITGSETQKYLEEYNQVIRKFSQRDTELLAQQIQAVKDKNMKKADSILQLSNNNKLREFLFSVNFALLHKDSYIAPYVALSQGYALQQKYLDSIYNSLPENVANSRYGKQLKDYIADLSVERTDDTDE